MSKYGIARFTLGRSLGYALPSQRAIYAQTAHGRAWVCPAKDISYINPETMVALLNAGLAASDIQEALEAAVGAIAKVKGETE